MLLDKMRKSNYLSILLFARLFDIYDYFAYFTFIIIVFRLLAIYK